MTQAKHHSRDLNIWIDAYDDLFSDFDPRPFMERVISDDFIVELNKLTSEHTEFIRTLRFQIPEKMRDLQQEKIIIERLQEHFKHEHLSFDAEVKANYRKGFVMALSGVVLLMGAVAVTSFANEKMWHNYLMVILQPAGWFLLWSGMDKIAFGGRQTKIKRDFYSILAKCKVEFVAI